MSTRRRAPTTKTPALNALSMAEKGELLDKLLTVRPELREQAEDLAAQRLVDEDRSAVADDVESALRDQRDEARWPALRAKLAAAFATRTQIEWTAAFTGTDACVAPVLSLREAAAYPHLAARRSLVEIDGVLQAMPAPRFSRHPAQRIP